MFVFDTTELNPCRLLHFHASPICLMVQAQRNLCNSARLKSNKVDAAQLDVNILLDLYQRHPGRREHLAPAPASYFHAITVLQQPNTHPGSHVLPTIPSSPPLLHPSSSAPSMGHRFDLHPEVPELTPSSSARTVDGDLHPGGLELSRSSSTTTLDASEDTGVDPDMDAQEDLQLLEYAKERAMTWDDLKTRPPLFPGQDGGTWQFSSAEQIIRGEWH